MQHGVQVAVDVGVITVKISSLQLEIDSYVNAAMLCVTVCCNNHSESVTVGVKYYYPVLILRTLIVTKPACSLTA